MLAFHFYSHIGWKWNAAFLGWLEAVANYARLYSFVEGTAAVQTVFYLCLALVVLILIDAVCTFL